MFLLIGFIPQSDWEALLYFIKNNYPTKNFCFCLSPGASIQGFKSSLFQSVATSADLDSPALPISISYISNDPDYTCKQLQGQLENKTEIVNLTPKTSFADLIFEKHAVKIPGSTKIRYVYQPTQLLRSLEEGNNVIINGDMSPTLYQELYSFTTGKSQKENYCNGVKLNIKG